MHFLVIPAPFYLRLCVIQSLVATAAEGSATTSRKIKRSTSTPGFINTLLSPAEAKLYFKLMVPLVFSAGVGTRTIGYKIC